MSLPTILFDLDGTIANTNEVILHTIAETLEYASGRVWQRAELIPHWGMRLRDQLMVLYPEIDLASAVPYYRQLYTRYHDALLAEFPGVTAMLETLQAGGYRLGVVTSKKRESAWITIKALAYEHYFDIVVAEEDTVRHKPTPDPLQFAAEKLGINIAEAIYVGDNPDDIRAASAAGMASVAVAWSLRSREELLAVKPHLIMESPEDLIVWLTDAKNPAEAAV